MAAIEIPEELIMAAEPLPWSSAFLMRMEVGTVNFATPAAALV